VNDPRKEISRGRKLLVAFIVISSMVLTTISFYGYQIIVTPNVLVDKQDRLILIPFEADFKYVQNMLYDEDIVQDLVTFSLVAKLMDYDKLVKPGLYTLEANMTNIDAVRLLRSGAQTPTRITFNNVRTLDDLAGKITRGISIDSVSFLQRLKDPELPAQFGLKKETFIGMFIPNTYEVYWTISEEELLERMYKEYNSYWNEERRNKAKAQGLTPEQAITLASIVNAETVKKDEAPIVAGLYLNRLKRGIPLQADPTLVFAHGDFNVRRVLNVHKEIDSPYNTYKYAGLPPGPINLPPIYAVDAVLNPAEHNYIYMCAKDDFSGYHYFTNSLTEHNRNAQKYQQALNRARVYN
jgi:UPF0755 protein